eukprot:3159109-Amphidinium_carterae.1
MEQTPITYSRWLGRVVQGAGFRRQSVRACVSFVGTRLVCVLFNLVVTPESELQKTMSAPIAYLAQCTTSSPCIGKIHSAMILNIT